VKVEEVFDNIPPLAKFKQSTEEISSIHSSSEAKYSYEIASG
jgi:hypothetical protein